MQAGHREPQPHPPDPKRATCVAIADNGMALTSDDFGRLRAWNINGAGSEPPPFAGTHAGKVAYVATAGKRVLTAGYDGNVLIHDLAHPEKFKTFSGHRQDGTNREVWVAILTPDGNRALSAANDGQILLWDPENPENMDAVVSFNRPAKAPKAPVAGLAFLPQLANNPTQFLSTYGYGDIHRWNLPQGNAVVAGPPFQTFSHKNSFLVNAVTVTKDGTRFVSASFDRTVRVWDLNNNQQEQHKFPKLHSQRIWRVALSPDFPIAATASDDGDIRFWNINSGRPIEKPVLKAGNKGSMGVAFTPDSRLVYTLDGTDPNRLIDVEADTPKA